MGFECGIVGLPNVGKSTLFNALTANETAASENYPFCTIEPNVGTVFVPDPRLDAIAAIVEPKRIVPTTIQFTDIAGLVKGAASGEGLGNKFLSHIQRVDAIAHVVRCFENGDITHVHNRIDPLEDIEIIDMELALKDLETVQTRLQKVEKVCKTGNKEALKEQAVLQQCQQHLEKNLPLRAHEWTTEQLQTLSVLNLLTIKPMMLIANIEDNSANEHLSAVIAYGEDTHAMVIPICIKIEQEISTLSPAEKKEFLQDLGLETSGLDQVIRAGYDLLGLSTFFTAGPEEVRAWTIREGSTAQQAAGVIHTDFAKRFIRAEVIAYDAYLEHRGESGAKEAGCWQLEGKEYLVQDGDVIYFRTDA